MGTSKIMVKVARAVAAMAEKTAAISASSTCYFCYHQPKVPAELKEFVKNKR